MIDTQESRRAYWTEQMDKAYGFMSDVMKLPVEECGEPLASLPDAVRASGVEVAFSTSKIVDDFDRIYYLRAGMIDDFIRIAREMNERGWVLKVEDGFRSTTMQKRLSLKPNVFDAVLERCTWEYGGTPPVDLLRRRLAGLTAPSPKIGTHMSGSAIDISVLSRDDGSEIDRGRPYLEMSELTPMESPFVSEQALQNRLAIREVMEKHRFLAYPYEFWHYNRGDVYDMYLNNTGQPAQYGAVDFDLATGEITPIADPTITLNPPEVLELAIHEALQRQSAKLEQNANA